MKWGGEQKRDLVSAGLGDRFVTTACTSMAAFALSAFSFQKGLGLAVTISSLPRLRPN